MYSKCTLTVIVLLCALQATILASSIVEENSEVEQKEIGFSKKEIDKILQIIKDFNHNAKTIGFDKFLSIFTECFASASDPYSPYEHGVGITPVHDVSKPISNLPPPHHNNRPPPSRPGNGRPQNHRPHPPNQNGWNNNNNGWNHDNHGWNQDNNGWNHDNHGWNHDNNGWNHDNNGWDHDNNGWNQDNNGWDNDNNGWNQDNHGWSQGGYHDDEQGYDSDFGWSDNGGWSDQDFGYGGWSDMDSYENHGEWSNYQKHENKRPKPQTSGEPPKSPVNSDHSEGTRRPPVRNKAPFRPFHSAASRCIPVGIKCSLPSEENQSRPKVGNEKTGSCCNEDRCLNKTCCIPTPSGRLHSACSSDSQCCNNGFCDLTTKMCYLRSGANCTDSKSCANTQCTENKCCNPAKGIFPCQDSGDCCSGICSDGFCKASSGQKCQADFQCASDKCNDGLC